MGIVTESCIEGVITGRVRKLAPADRPPMVVVSKSDHGSKAFVGASLVVTRYGNTESLPLTRRVAEELIAAGFAYGD